MSDVSSTPISKPHSKSHPLKFDRTGWTNKEGNLICKSPPQ